jgi:STAS-like domain of unknown function (DUF4325)
MMEANTRRISVADDFSKYPGGRYKTDGEFSGERFRDDILVPALVGTVQVVVNLNGTLGFGSSFLEEAFGGLIRVSGFTLPEIKEKIILEADSDVIKGTINFYLERAIPKEK